MKARNHPRDGSGPIKSKSHYVRFGSVDRRSCYPFVVFSAQIDFIDCYSAVLQIEDSQTRNGSQGLRKLQIVYFVTLGCNH